MADNNNSAKPPTHKVYTFRRIGRKSGCWEVCGDAWLDEKTRDIGVMKALGASNAGVREIFLGYGLLLSNDPITKILFATAVPFAEIAVNLAFVTVTTRVLFAQAFDRLLPVGVAKIGDRNHAPNVAIGLVLVIGIAFCFLTSLVNLGSIVALQSLFFALILLAGGVAALFLPLRRPDLIELPGASDDARKAFLRKAAWVGGATTVLALFTVFELVTHSSVYGKFSWESILTLVIVLGAGPVIYAIARSIRRQRDALDLSMAMHELPPE